MKKSITVNYIYNLMYQIISLISPLILVPFLTRSLGGSNLGIFSYVLSIITIFYSISALGINLYAQREIAYLQDENEKRNIFFWEMFFMRIISSIITIFCLIIFALIVPNYKIYYFLFLPYIVSNIFDITWLYQGMEDFKGVSLRNLFVKLLFIISVVFLVKTKDDLGMYIVIYSLQFLLTALSFWIGLKKYVSMVDIKNLNVKRHLKNVLLFFVPQIATTLYTIIDKTMIGIIIPKIDNVYYYEQATYIVKTILILVTTIGTVMMSNVSYSFKKRDYSKIKENLLTIITFVWLFGCPLAFGICAVIKNIIPWFYGIEYISISQLVYFLAPIIIVIGLNNVLGYQLLIPIKRQDKYIRAIITGMIVNLILNTILINSIGAIGAAIASVFSEIIILFIELKYCKDIIKLKDLYNHSLKYVIFGIIMFIFTYFIGSIIEPSVICCIIQIITGGFVYLILLVLSRDTFFYNYIIAFLKNYRRKEIK